MSFDYNTQSEPIILKEYGRNVQKIVDHITTVEDQEERLKLAKVLIEMMKQLNPSISENQDYIDRIWNHIFIISDFKLDLVGAPVEKPETSVFEKKPEKVPYSTHRIKFMHYGKNIENLIDEARKEEDPEQKKDKTVYVARLMKKFYMTWNKEGVENQVILSQMERMSGGELVLDEAEVEEKNWLFVNSKDITPQNLSTETFTPSKNKNNGGKNYGRNNNNNNKGRNNNNNQKNRKR